MKSKIAQDIDSITRLNMLPHIVLLFTVISGVQSALAIFWISRVGGGSNSNSQLPPDLASILVFTLMILILIKYRRGESNPQGRDAQTSYKLPIICFSFGALFIAAPSIEPMFQFFVSGGSLIISGFLAILLNRRIQL